MQFYIVDVFANKKYQGNPLAVLIPDRPIDTSEMQLIAKEIHFSETTFIMSGKKPDGGYDVRIFSPDVELPFAGHPTLGTAFIISKIMEGGSTNTIRLNLQVGQIPVTVLDDEWTMQQNQPTFGMMLKAAKQVAEMVNLHEEDIDDRFPIEVTSTGLPSVIVPLKSLSALQKCRVNHDQFQDFMDHQIKANILLFTRGEETATPQLRVRVFVDESGFFEDPATGSANGNLAAYVIKHRYFGADSINYEVLQGVEMGRPSLLKINASQSEEEYQLLVGGKVFLVAKGDWE